MLWNLVLQRRWRFAEVVVGLVAVISSSNSVEAFALVRPTVEVAGLVVADEPGHGPVLCAARYVMDPVILS